MHLTRTEVIERLRSNPLFDQQVATWQNEMPADTLQHIQDCLDCHRWEIDQHLMGVRLKSDPDTLHPFPLTDKGREILAKYGMACGKEVQLFLDIPLPGDRREPGDPETFERLRLVLDTMQELCKDVEMPFTKPWMVTALASHISRLTSIPQYRVLQIVEHLLRAGLL